MIFFIGIPNKILGAILGFVEGIVILYFVIAVFKIGTNLLGYEMEPSLADVVVETPILKHVFGATLDSLGEITTMAKEYEYTKDKLEGFDLICMNRGNKTAITDFKKSKNGVIFASGPMWEGIDCVGDCLSSVIIVRLPFPIRSTLLNEKKAAKENVQEFIKEYAVPEMIIKLRQGIGRLVRSENDTGLISILDSRATDCCYSDVIRKTLAKYPRVKSIDEITDFFKSVKTESYFEK